MSNTAQQLHQKLGVDNALFMKQVQGGNWDELANGLEGSIRHQIAESANLVAMAEATVKAAGTGNAEFYTLANGTLRDLKRFTDLFNVLVQRRAGRTGPTRSSEEYTEYLSIGLELTTLTEELQVVVGHTLFTMSDAHGNALEILRAREEAEKKEEADTLVTQEVQPIEPEVTTEKEVTA